MKCPECGTETAPGEQFCGNCGAPIPAAEESLPDPDREPEPFGDETVYSQPAVIPPLEPEPEPDPEFEPSMAPEEPELAPPPPPPPAPPQGQDKKKTWIIVGIVVAVLLLCCCCVALIIGVFVANQDEIMEAIESVRVVAPLVAAVV